MQYPADLRDVVVRRILAHEISARDAVDEYGVAHSTVYHWVSRARKQAASHDDAALTPSGMMMPPTVFVSAGAGSMSTRSANGLMFIMDKFYSSTFLNFYPDCYE